MHVNIIPHRGGVSRSSSTKLFPLSKIFDLVASVIYTIDNYSDEIEAQYASRIHFNNLSDKDVSTLEIIEKNLDKKYNKANPNLSEETISSLLSIKSYTHIEEEVNPFDTAYIDFKKKYTKNQTKDDDTQKKIALTI